MGNSPSTSSNEGAAVSLPSSIGPLWSNNSDGQDNGNGPVSSVIKFNLPKYDKVYMKTRLSIPVDNTSYLHLDCSNKGLSLKSSTSNSNNNNSISSSHEENVAICKKGKRGGYDIYKYEPVYPNQVPSSSKKTLLFLYARVNTKGTVQLVNDEPNKPSYVIVNGPKNSNERSLVKIPKPNAEEEPTNVTANDDTNDDDDIDGGDDDEAMSETIAIWKYRDRANRVEVFTDNESGGGNSSMTAFVFCLVVIADLMSVNSNMNQLGTTAVIASLRPF